MTAWRIVQAAAGLAVMAGAILFLAQALLGSWHMFAGMVVDAEFVLTTFLLSLAYGACLFILSGSWYLTLRRHATAQVPASSGAYVYCVANIAKYLPGNVFHFAGRQILGARTGWGHRAIAKATMLELGAIVTGIMLLVLLAIAFGPVGVTELVVPQRWVTLTAPFQRPLAFAALASAALVFCVMSRRGIFERLLGLSANSVAGAVALCMLFFALYAALVMMFAYRLPFSPQAHPLFAVGVAYLLAWLAGFVVPGAPGGLGVRESVLILLLAGSNDTDNACALSLGLGMRFVTTLGDAVAAAVALAFFRARKNAGPR